MHGQAARQVTKLGAYGGKRRGAPRLLCEAPPVLRAAECGGDAHIEDMIFSTLLAAPAGSLAAITWHSWVQQAYDLPLCRMYSV